MLERKEPVISQHRRVRMTEDGEDAALVLRKARAASGCSGSSSVRGASLSEASANRNANQSPRMFTTADRFRFAFDARRIALNQSS
jgi:hypothetical protein